jgi:DNA-binding response OmpR family regulator
MRRVVVIEDDEGIGLALRIALEDRGYHVEVYADPVEVPYDSLDADVILVDFFMPQLDGEQVILRLQQVPQLKESRILLMSATPNLLDQAMRLGVECITKPFDLQTLVQVIERP